MADFDAARQFQRTLAVGAGIAFHDITQVDKFRFGAVAAEVKAGVVVVVFVGADDGIGQFFGSVVGIDFALDAYRTE